MKWIQYEGRRVSLPELATILGVARATLARRVREHKRHRMTREEMLTAGPLPRDAPPVKRQPIDVDRLRSLLQISHGSYPPVAAFYGVTRARVQQMVKRAGLLDFARALRAAKATPAPEA